MPCRMLRRLSVFVAAALAWIAVGAVPGRAAMPADFTDTLVTSVGVPTAIVFTPDGRLLITQQTGSLRVYQGGVLLATPALTFPVTNICTVSEQGLLGVEVHPAFTSNQFIYLFYTFKQPGGTCVNRVSRFTLPASNVINPATELVLIDNMPSTHGNHNAGDLHFGKDGFLYVSIGEGGVSEAARNEHVLSGKILRITDSGGIPPTNPFQGLGTARCNVTGSTTPGNRCQETFAWGLRNPFRFAMDPNAAGTRFFINDVGHGAYEEIDNGQAGADYGWNCREAAHTHSTTGQCSPTPPGMVDPLFEYTHHTIVPGTSSTNCNSITGGAFVPNGVWPGFDGSYLFADFICGSIFKLTNVGGAWSASDFVTGLGNGSAVHLLFGPHGSGRALYYTTYAGGGQVRRIAFEPPPLVFFSVTPCRVADTRNAPGPQGGPALTAGVPRNFTVRGSCAVPATAKAVAVNVTVISPAAAGSLFVHPTDAAMPAANTVSFRAGQTRANNAVLRLGAAGDLRVLCSMPGGSAHFALDVVGYFE